MLQIQARYLLLAAVFSLSLHSLSIPVSLSSQTNIPVSLSSQTNIPVSLSSQTNIISSQGMINYEKDKPWWGICVVDTAFETWGLYFTEHHINLAKDAGANAWRIMLDKKPWDKGYTTDVLGIPYKDYIKQLTDWCHQKEMKVLLDLAMDTDSWSSPYYKDKINMMRTPSLYQDWVDWGVEVINHCNPDAILIIDEPAGYYQMQETGFTYEEYEQFVKACITAWRNADPNIIIFLFDVRFTAFPNFGDNPLPYDNLVYTLNYPYYSGSGSGWRGYYYNGQFEEAKADLYHELDTRIGGLKALSREGEYPKVCLTVSVAYHEGLDTCKNWDKLMKDTYDYCTNNSIILFQYAYAKWRWTILNEDRTDLNEVGQFWAQNSP